MSTMIIDYLLLSGDSAKALSAEVLKYIQTGWVPFRNPFADSDVTNTRLYQAVVRYS